MENDKPPKSDSFLGNPQILAAIIGGAVTIVVAIIGIVPALVNNKPTPTPAPTIIVVTATTLPPENTQIPPTLTSIPILAPTDAVQTPLPISDTVTNLPQPTPAKGNILVFYDEVSFTLQNQSVQKVSLDGIVFRSTAGQWEARTWGPGVYNALPAGECLRLRDATVGQRQPPSPCRNHIFGLQEVGTSALFWIGVDQFDVLHNETIIATCLIADTTCMFNI
jgi:hypothetical protein